jgi:hypothetical protein
MASGMATMIEVPETITLHIEGPGRTVTVDGNPDKDGACTLAAGKHFPFAVVSNDFGHGEKETEIRFHELSGYTLHKPINGNRNSPWCRVPFAAAQHVSRDLNLNFLVRPGEIRLKRLRIGGLI